MTDRRGFALYFSRSPIPHLRGITADQRRRAPLNISGLYVQRREFLLKVASLEPTPLERSEALEQLRVLEHGFSIKMVETKHDSIGVDTPEDLERVRRLLTADVVPRSLAGPLRRARSPVNRMLNTQTRPVKYIFVTGGVVSSLGKGLAAASIGALLEGHGYKVTLQKFDPYINVDPGHDEPVSARRGLRHR